MKVYVLSYGISDPHMGLHISYVRVFSDKNKAQKALADTFAKDVANLKDWDEFEEVEENKPTSYRIHGCYDDYVAFIEEKELEGE